MAQKRTSPIFHTAMFTRTLSDPNCVGRAKQTGFWLFSSMDLACRLEQTKMKVSYGMACSVVPLYLFRVRVVSS
jgi:hypothetical protein